MNPAHLLFILCLLMTTMASSDSGADPSMPPHPGSTPRYPALQIRLEKALADLDDRHEPRTRHRDVDGGAIYLNRLIEESSPYLRQHAHNPVDWFPWGEEALERARELDRPIFLSIGYSTCHWCHVMEEESFDDLRVAEVLNQHFVPIKVDREIRPDLDEIYMTAVQLTSGRGGWPMSSFLTPDGRPFFGGTYFPREQFLLLLQRVHGAWRTDRAEIEKSATRIATAVAEVTGLRGESRELAGGIAERARDLILERADLSRGGLTQGAPRFPHEAELLFLLDRSWRDHEDPGGPIALQALRAMAKGGIRDHLGGGFHRYSTDERWLVPHFEKMLYNQALLGRAYARATALSEEPLFARVARQTLDYVLRDLTEESGGFFSATDADSEGEEGTFFVWTPAQIEDRLSEDEAALALDVWGVTEAGNFEGSNVLHLPMPLATAAEQKGWTETQLFARLDPIREKLRLARQERPHPLLDDKILTAWNALMITALAEGGDLLAEPRYSQAALRAGEEIWSRHRLPDGRLLRALGGTTPGGLDDHAFLGEALLVLYDTTGGALWLDRARELAGILVELFWDEESGGFFLSDASDLFARPKSPTDGALPSGNGVAVQFLSGLASRTGDESFADRARATLAAFGASVERAPAAYVSLLRGAEQLERGEAGPRGYGAGGVLAAHARLESEPESGRLALELRLRLAHGWHINSHEPRQAELIPTEIEVATEGWRLDQAEYPPGEQIQLGFQDEPLLVYQGEVVLGAKVERSEAGRRPMPLRLRFQACDDRRCLKPEILRLEVPIDAL